MLLDVVRVVVVVLVVVVVPGNTQLPLLLIMTTHLPTVTREMQTNTRKSNHIF